MKSETFGPAFSFVRFLASDFQMGLPRPVRWMMGSLSWVPGSMPSYIYQKRKMRRKEANL